MAIGTKHGAVKVLGREGVERLLRVEVHCAINTRRLYFNRSPVYLICVQHRAALARVPSVVSSVRAEPDPLSGVMPGPRSSLVPGLCRRDGRVVCRKRCTCNLRVESQGSSPRSHAPHLTPQQGWLDTQSRAARRMSLEETGGDASS